MISFICNFARLIIRSLVLRSLTCVFFYLFCGIPAAFASDDIPMGYTGNFEEIPEDQPFEIDNGIPD